MLLVVSVASPSAVTFSHRKVLLENRPRELLEVIEVVRFAEEIHGEKTASKSGGKFTRAFDSLCNFLPNPLDVDVGAGPVCQLDEDCTGYLHIKDVEESIAFLLHLLYFVLQALHNVLVTFFRWCG